MNLVTDKWFSGMTMDGTEEELSLYEAFEKADRIVSIGGPFLDKIAVHSLLVGIAQDAMGGEFSEQKWQEMLPKMQATCLSYLSQNKDRFDLYGQGRFAQIDAARGLCNTKRVCLSPSRPSGNNHTFHAHSAEEDPAISDPEIAMCLLTQQMLSCGGLFKKEPLPNWTYRDDVVIDKTKKGKEIRRRNSPLLAGKLVVLVEGSSLLDTLWLNLATKEQMQAVQSGGLPAGVPFWRRRLTSAMDFAAYAGTFFGRILPMPYAIWLESGTDVSISRTLSWCVDMHPLLTYRKIGKENVKIIPLAALSSQEVWRQVGSSLGMMKDVSNPLSPLEHLTFYEKKYFVFAGGGVFGTNDSNFEDFIECCFHGQVGWSQWRESYTACFEAANKVAFAMGSGLSEYARSIAASGESPLSAKGIIRESALTEYWSKVSNCRPLLIDALGGGESKREEWRKMCIKTAINVFERRTNHKPYKSRKGYVAGYEKMLKCIMGRGDKR